MLHDTQQAHEVIDSEGYDPNTVVDAQVVDDTESSNVTGTSEPSARESKHFVERHPCKLMTLAILLYIALAVLMVALGGGWPIQIASLENMARSSNPAYTQNEAIKTWERLLGQGKFENSTSNSRRRLQSPPVYQSTIQVFYQLATATNATSTSIFDHIVAIREFEANLVDSRFCAHVNGDCSTVYPYRDSPVNHFFPTLQPDGTTWLLDGNGAEQRTQNSVLQRWLLDGTARFFSKASLTGDFAMTRSSFTVQSTNSQQELRDYINTEMLAYLTAGNAAHRENFSISWYGDNLIGTELNNALLHDTMLVLASVGTVAIMFLLLMGFDVFICLVGLLSLALAFPLAYAFFTVAFGFEEIFALSFLSLYILFGVGSDACFIHLDEMVSCESFVQAWVRGAKATFVTLSTTAICFLVNASSPINVFREWGIFMGITCLFCWLTVNSIFPFVIYLRRNSITEKERFRIRAAFHACLFACVKRTKWLALLVSIALALVCIGFLFPAEGESPFRIGEAKSYSSAFFNPVTHNLGRIYALRDEFDWIADKVDDLGGDNGGGSGNGGGGGTVVQCPSDAYQVIDNVCVLIPVKFELVVGFALAVGGNGRCICDVPSNIILQTISSETTWPLDDMEIVHMCDTETTDCSSGAPIVTIRFTADEQDSVTSLSNELGAIRAGDSLGGFIVLATTLTSTLPTPSPTLLPTLAPTVRTSSPQVRTLQPTTLEPTLRPVTLFPTPPTIPLGEYEEPDTLAPVPSPTQQPTQFPTLQPTSLEPTLQPTSAAPTMSPSNSAPTATPTIPTNACIVHCGEHGECNPASRTCKCYLGYTGTNCSVPVSIELSDSASERITIGFGLQQGDATRLDESFDIANSPQLQTDLLAICAAFCFQNNETTVQESRCSKPPFIWPELFVGVDMPVLDLAGMGYRRLIYCGISDFAYYILGNGGEFPVQSAKEFNSWVNRFYLEYPTYSQDTKLLGRRNGTLVYISNLFQTSVSSLQTNAQDANAHYIVWRQVFAPLGGVISSGLFAMSETQVALVDSIWRNLILSAAFSLLGVLVYTQSVVLTLLCALSILCSMLGLLGVCFLLMQWTLGLVEAVGLMIAVGLMVDYNVHLAYSFSFELDATEALRHISFAIVCAALTTVGTCIPLLFTEMLPFSQFGIIIMLSVSLCLIYVFAFLTPLLFAMGKTTVGLENKAKQCACVLPARSS